MNDKKTKKTWETPVLEIEYLDHEEDILTTSNFNASSFGGSLGGWGDEEEW